MFIYVCVCVCIYIYIYIYIYIFPKFLDDIRVDIRRKNTTMLLSVQYMFRIVPIHHQLLITMKNFLVHKQTLNHQSNLLVEKGINVAKKNIYVSKYIYICIRYQCIEHVLHT